MPAPDVVVVGGGVIGCSVAYHLRGLGLSTLVLESGQMGGQATRAAAGMLAPLTESRGPGPFLELGLRSLAMFEPLADALREESGVDVELRRSGLLLLALDAAEERDLRERLAWLRELDAGVRWLTPTEVRELEPLATEAVCGALFVPREGHISSTRWLDALALAARRRGVQMREGCPVIGVLADGGRATGVLTAEGPVSCGHVVIAAGAWAGLLAANLGIRVPVFPVRGQVLALRGRPVSGVILFGRPGYVVSKPDGSVIVGATEDEVGFDNRVTAGGMLQLLEVVPAIAPALAGAQFLRAWAGLRPASADLLPVIGPAPGLEGVTLAGGHYRNGILLSPVTGALVAKLIAQGEMDPMLGPLNPARFANAPNSADARPTSLA